MMKVFGIGFQKTGTTTLDEALTILGYNVTGPNLYLAESLLKQDYTKTFELVEKFDAFQDNPWPLLYQQLDEKYPDSKFILTIRDEEKWINSIINHFGKDKTKMREWVYGEASPYGHEEHYLAVYQSHSKEVLAYFENRSDDLLVLDWSKNEGWEKLCLFLNKEIPSIPFPHANKGKYEDDLFNKMKSFAKSILRFLNLR